MKQSFAGFEDCLDAIAGAKTLVAAAAPLREIAEKLGALRVGVVADFNDTELLAENGVTLAHVFGWEQRFIDDWVKNRLHRVDPGAQACRVAVKPFVWDATAVSSIVAAVAPGKPIWHLGPERGIAGGIVVPIHLPLSRVGSVGWTSFDSGLDLDGILARHGVVLRAAATLFMDRVYAARRDRSAGTSAAHLTEREIECLTWVALGKTDFDIGLIIGRAPSTARFHVEKATEKLGASNRTRAVAIAAQLGIIRALG